MHLSVAIPGGGGGGDPRDIHGHGAGLGEICWQLLAWDGGIALILYFFSSIPRERPILVLYSHKLMHGFAKFLNVLLHSLLLRICTVFKDNTIQCHAQICWSIGQPSKDLLDL